MSTTEHTPTAQPATADREIVVSRSISAPTRARVRGVHRGAAPVAVVGGPEGFTTTTRAFEFRVGGGEWDFVMHGPDGTDYPPEWISWTEITPPPERIALRHGEHRDDPDSFESVLTFTPDGATTRLEMRTVFRTAAQRDEAVEKYHAIEGGRQTLGHLAAYVTRTAGTGTEP